ncbi:phospholipase A2 like protein [Danaus plexippus plexippus]|uniref:Phospholipase A2 n=1 Tax=Danaus plexippus plexippus TaxID=278856 RepID=A0A212F4F0_DANPL|nr:phospholipase A2 like protein [Danaus plexippus plexippus]
MKIAKSCVILFVYIELIQCKSIDIEKINDRNNGKDGIDNNIIDFDDEYSVQYSRKYENEPWKSSFRKDSYKYNVERQEYKQGGNIESVSDDVTSRDPVVIEKTTELSVIPLELLSTTENPLISIMESTTDADLTVIPLSTTEKNTVDIIINQTVTLPSYTEISEDFNTSTVFYEMTTRSMLNDTSEDVINNKQLVSEAAQIQESGSVVFDMKNASENLSKPEVSNLNDDDKNLNKINKTIKREYDSIETDQDVPIFTELDTEELTEVPEDYYDSKDVVPTPAPKTDAISLIFGLAGSVVESVVESVAERVVPRGLYDLFKRMQKQSEALEAEKLRSREENGGIGQFTRGVIKTISSGLSKPLSQLMAGVRDIGSLDSDRGFVSSVASGVTSVANVANSMVDVFKDRVQAIYPGTLWCGDGRSARSGELGLFFFTDTCCRQHDACKLYIAAGETKFGLTNTGLFTRSHCSCDAKFRSCLSQTNSLVSAQIGLTYFNVLGPQCFRKTHPIVKCVRRTRITGLKCEEYELDYTKPKIWQWFDNETF